MLLEICIRIKQVNNIIFAIYKPRYQIILTLILFLIFIYYFSLIALTSMSDLFKYDQDTHTMIDCILRIFDQTFKQDGGIGNYLDVKRRKDYNPNTYNMVTDYKFYYDNIFSILIIIFIFQMFLSIIKDYFSRQREKQERFQQTLESKCLICGQERGDIEKIYSNYKNGFNIHIKSDHNINDYICYLNYLHCKSKKAKFVEDAVWKYHLSSNYLFLPKYM
jgi:hypothetical protein